MAFYSYVMMKDVHVGTEAILHVVREQHDGRMTQEEGYSPPAPTVLEETSIWLDEC